MHSLFKNIVSLDFIKKIIFLIKKRHYTFSPVFIIGCGRSGTTILGNILSCHPKIKYLNERRDIWHKSYPEFNIWSQGVQNSKLYVDENDIVVKNHNLLQYLFFREQVLANAQILLEKLPINSFRLRFLQKSFPNAKYIYLTRNGLEVSNSIEKEIQKGSWLRAHDLLKNFDIKNNDQNKGILEWKLSISHSHHFFSRLSNNYFFHLSYHDFVNSPEKMIRAMFDFLNLDYTENWINRVSKNIKRKNPEIKKVLDKDTYVIGGEILNQTINNTYNPSIK